MSLVITKGYLIKKSNYNLFDEIIVFLNEYGRKFTCYSPGTRKINSKNARSLSFGNFLEFEIFYSNSDKKIHRLKKVTALNQIEFSRAMNLGLLIANDMVAIKQKTLVDDYKFYQNVLVKVYQQVDELQIAIYAYTYYMYTTFKNWKIFKCKIHQCYSTGMDLFSTNLFVCPSCCEQNMSELLLDEFRFIVSLLNCKTSAELFTECFTNKYNINWKRLYNHLNYLFNHYIRVTQRKYLKGK